MTVQRLAFLLSVGLHAALLTALPLTTPVAFDMMQAATSVEIFLAPTAPVLPPRPPEPVPPPRLHPVLPAPEPEPQAPTPTPAPEPTPAEPPPLAEPAPPSPPERGALTEVLPGYLRNPPPVYPQAARRRWEEGRVLLHAEILPSGRCGTLHVLRSSGYALLDTAAFTAVQRWQFRPARRLGLPVAVWVEIPIRFRLEE